MKIHTPLTCTICASLGALALCVAIPVAAYYWLGPFLYGLVPARIPDWVIWWVCVPLLPVSVIGMLWFGTDLLRDWCSPNKNTVTRVTHQQP